MLSDNLWNFPESQSTSAQVKTRVKTDIHVEIINGCYCKLWKWQLDAFGSEKKTTIILEITDTQNENNNETLVWQLQPPSAQQHCLWLSNHDPKNRAHGTTMRAQRAVLHLQSQQCLPWCRGHWERVAAGGPECEARCWTQWFLQVPTRTPDAHCFYWMPQDFVQGSFDSSLQRNPVQVIEFLETTPVLGSCWAKHIW